MNTVARILVFGILGSAAAVGFLQIYRSIVGLHEIESVLYSLPFG